MTWTPHPSHPMGAWHQPNEQVPKMVRCCTVCEAEEFRMGGCHGRDVTLERACGTPPSRGIMVTADTVRATGLCGRPGYVAPGEYSYYLGTDWPGGSMVVLVEQGQTGVTHRDYTGKTP